jgi:hypothetical protein
MGEVPKNARDILIAGALEGDGKVWIYELALSALDAQEAAEEGVTPGLMNVFFAAVRQAIEADAPSHMTCGVVAVYPAIFAAGERAGLERAAADYERRADERDTEADECEAEGYTAGAEVARSLASHYRLTACELRSLKGGTP